MLILVIVILIGISISVSFGAANIDFFEVWQAILKPDLSLSNHAVINQVRLPRVLAGLLVGASLAVAGALMQGMTRNL